MNIKSMTLPPIARKLRNSYNYHKKVNQYQNKENLSNNLTKEIRKYWSKYNFKISLKWHSVYSTFNKIFSEKYIPEPLFYNFIERQMNDFGKVPAYRDKNNYYKFLPRAKFPISVLKNMNGKFFVNESTPVSSKEAEIYLKGINDKMIIKPSMDTGGGKGIKSIDIIENKIHLDEREVSFAQIHDLYNKDYIIQKVVNQHHSLSEVYPKSLNTLRLMTVKVDSGYHCVSAVIRFGNNNSIVDNIKTNDGVACGISKHGVLNSYGMNSKGEKKYQHSFTKVDFKDLRIDKYREIEKTVEKLHNDLPYFDIVSWDVAINEKGEIIIIEFNISGQEINFHQFNNGPLFGQYTDEIIDRITKS